jgi:hypothetical protein
VLARDVDDATVDQRHRRRRTAQRETLDQLDGSQPPTPSAAPHASQTRWPRDVSMRAQGLFFDFPIDL